MHTKIAWAAILNTSNQLVAFLLRFQTFFLQETIQHLLNLIVKDRECHNQQFRIHICRSELANHVREDHQADRIDSMGDAISEPAIDAGNGTDGNLPVPRCRFMDRAF